MLKIPRSKFFLAFFLSLLVWPGVGSFLVQRRREGISQVFLAVFSLALLLVSFGVIINWVVPIVADAEALSMGPDDIALYISENYVVSPPLFLGFSAPLVVMVSLAMFFVAWVYSLVSLLLARKSVDFGK
jgi:hypothetical protein